MINRKPRIGEKVLYESLISRTKKEYQVIEYANRDGIIWMRHKEEEPVSIIWKFKENEFNNRLSFIE